ncbi:MAG: type IV secretory system conjugative DNA transfer family protein [Alphaproteobacteria bacterium]|nr:type IV secretory system conjugative DNA transfer family protein [Alphaproteobacteria bacterium]
MAGISQSRGWKFSLAAFCIGIFTIGICPEAFAQFDGGSHYSFFSRLKPMLLSGIIGYGVGAFFSPALRPFRRTFAKILGAAIVLYALFTPAPIGDFLSSAIAGCAFIVAYYFGIRLSNPAEVPERRRPTSFGSAQWADLNHLLRNGIIGSDGYMLGEFVTNTGAHPMQYKGERHLLTVAPTRSGKGVSSIIPNLLMYQGSAFVIDPKGENALVTAFRRGAGSSENNIPGLGQDVVLLDPWDVAASKLGMKPSSFNPIDWIKADDPDAAENAFLLADALVISEAQGDDKFWDEEAKALLTGIILYVGTAEEEEGQRNLGRVRDILNMTDAGQRKILEQMFGHPHPLVRATAARQASKEERLYSAVLASVQSHTHFLDSARIRKSLECSDFHFEDLKKKPTTVYLILPADRLKTFDRWLRLLIQQAITVNARNIDRKPEKPILFLLDEMPTLGRLPALEQAYGLMAGFGMQLWGIVQDLSQLARVYGEHGWQTFISNSGVIQYFGSRDKMTAEYFSSLCGVTTVVVRNFSSAIGNAISSGFSSSSSFGSTGGSSGTSNSSNSNSSWTRTAGTNEAQRHLAYPDELMVLKNNEQIVFVENLDPIPGKKILWYRNTALKALGVNLQEKVSVKDNTTAC